MWEGSGLGWVGLGWRSGGLEDSLVFKVSFIGDASNA